MKTEEAQHLFEIHVEEFSEWKKRPHKHSFFEMVYVEKGSGFQCINEHEFAYREGNVFLLPPLDCHSFKIEEPSRFYFIRFTDHYFLQNAQSSDSSDWFDRMAYILANYNKVPGDIIGTERERTFIVQTIRSIHQEYLTGDQYSNAIISGAMASILNILARSIEQQYVEQANETDSRFGEILRYINTHIDRPEQTKIPFLSEKFDISSSYFSEYFKKHAGVPLADYLTPAKHNLVETKVLHTDLTLKEIAFQLNFTDSSHLSRSFKKAYGMTIKEFKNEGKRQCGYAG